MNGITPTKISDLVKYESIKSQDFLLITENSSSVLGKNSSSYTTFSDFYNFVISEQTSFTGSFTGSFVNNDNILSGSISGSLQGSLLSTNTEVSGGFSGSLQGSIVSKNVHATGSFSGSLAGKMTSENISVSGSIEGDLKASSLTSKYARLSNCDFSGSLKGDCELNNSLVTGSFTGSFLGKLTSPYMIGSGSFQGNIYADSIVSKNTNIVDTTFTTNVLSASSVETNRFEGPTFNRGGNGLFIGSGSFLGDERYFFNVNGKKVTFQGTSSYAISSSHADVALGLSKAYSGTPIILKRKYGRTLLTNNVLSSLTLTKPIGTEWFDFCVEVTALLTAEGGGILDGYIYYGDDIDVSVNYASGESGGLATGNSGYRWISQVDDDGVIAVWYTEGDIVNNMLTNNENEIKMNAKIVLSDGSIGDWKVFTFTARYYYP